MQTQQFREKVYQSMRKRADGILDLVDALTVAGHVDSPVALSEETPFRRKYSSIFDTLRYGEIDFDHLLQTLFAYQPSNSEELAGCEVYGLDCTPNEREEAETLEDRVSLKAQKDDPVRYGHKYSWLVRLIQWGTSWVAPVDVRRVDSSLSDSEPGALQVAKADLRHPKQKVMVADSLYGNQLFLAIFLMIQYAYALVRLRSDLVFTNAPISRPNGNLFAGRTKLETRSLAGTALQKTVRFSWHGAASRVLTNARCGCSGRVRKRFPGGPLPHVPVAICN